MEVTSAFPENLSANTLTDNMKKPKLPWSQRFNWSPKLTSSEDPSTTPLLSECATKVQLTAFLQVDACMEHSMMLSSTWWKTSASVHLSFRTSPEFLSMPSSSTSLIQGLAWHSSAAPSSTLTSRTSSPEPSVLRQEPLIPIPTSLSTVQIPTQLSIQDKIASLVVILPLMQRSKINFGSRKTNTPSLTCWSQIN